MVLRTVGEKMAASMLELDGVERFAFSGTNCSQLTKTRARTWKELRRPDLPV